MAGILAGERRGVKWLGAGGGGEGGLKFKEKSKIFI